VDDLSAGVAQYAIRFDWKRELHQAAGMADPIEVDSWRFLPPGLAQLLKVRLDASPPVTSIPFTPLAVPLSTARIALLSTAGISCPPDPPFDMEGERENPIWGDPSWRRIPATATAADVEVNHLHVDTSYARGDLNVVLPLQRLAELAAEGEVGSVAPTHYSVMGFQPDASAQVAQSAPAIAEAMRADGVTGAVLAPV
jgi:D-proline reductase (dithiol) PrdB